MKATVRGGLGVLAVLICLVVGCSSDGGGLAPGDHFFRTVVAGTSSTGTTINIVLFDAAFAAHRVPGAPGTTPGSHDAVGAVYTSGGAAPIELTGTYDPSGSFTLSGDGWSVEGSVDGSDVDGTVASPDGSGTFGGEDVMSGNVGTFCGSYTGDSSGEWNFVVSESGGVSGAFSGGASGSLSGSASGDSVRLNWFGTAYGDPAAGSASGTVDASGDVYGDWSGSSSGWDVSGSWQGSSTCAGPDPTVSSDTSDTCTCHGDNCCPAGWCCSSIF